MATDLKDINTLLATDTPLLATADLLALVDRRAALKREIAQREAEIKSIEEKFIAAGPGIYQGESGAKVQVISPAPSVQVPRDSKEKKAGKEAIAAIRAIIGEEETFKKLFWFVGAYILAADFRTKAGVLLTPARLEKVLAILETPGKPYVK